MIRNRTRLQLPLGRKSATSPGCVTHCWGVGRRYTQLPNQAGWGRSCLTVQLIAHQTWNHQTSLNTLQADTACPPGKRSAIPRRSSSLRPSYSPLLTDLRLEPPPAMPPWSNFQFWSPPEDPERPVLPYVSALTVTITEHVPPEPFGLPSVYPRIEPPYNISDEHLKTLTQTRLIVTCPPIETNRNTGSAITKTPPANAILEIEKPIAVEDGRGPKLVVCTITPQDRHSKPFQAVAKIFDPLYYSFKNENAPHRPVATTVKADSDYSIEAAAYAHLQKTGETGAFAPEYYGSWTFTLPIRHRGVQYERQVRLVLVEYIDGVCMRDLCYQESPPLGFTEEHRLDVLANILDGAARMDHSGINQRDLMPRNIILKLKPEVGGPPEEGRPRFVQRAVLIDYNISVVYHLSPEEWKCNKTTNLPVNPMELFWNISLDDFNHWVPKSWQCNERAQQQWLMGRFGGANAFSYAPLSRELKLDDP
ncbi:hypothetical protein B0J18DRAFT_433161 [Chaetomium sp. MPI-SDFR-AT-0129]|nr:hypothetical protein B0J18DRAFT_433161 [Chaetomium sp. MPI-SDFR-AT-0129]